jgi:hypothetical protein
MEIDYATLRRDVQSKIVLAKAHGTGRASYLTSN